MDTGYIGYHAINRKNLLVGPLVILHYKPVTGDYVCSLFYPHLNITDDLRLFGAIGAEQG